MGRRVGAPKRPVEFSHDGDTLVADRGEPIASALIAADRLTLARSPKLHRPRGPYCFRGSCDGCLARVNGEPNVTLCLRPARGGEVVETQNVLGARQLDLLQAADFLFPRGIDHHRLLAGVPVASRAVETFARKVAGLGRLPDSAGAVRVRPERTTRVLVVGGGAAGLAAAEALGAVRPLVADDGVEAGGSLLSLGATNGRTAAAAAAAAGATLLVSTTVAGVYRDGGGFRALLAGPEGVSLVRAEHLLIAAGTHAFVMPFAGNDLPGVVGARAATRLLSGGIVLGEPTVLVGAGRYADRFEEAAAGVVVVQRVDAHHLVRASGRLRTTGVVLRTVDGQRRVRAGALVVDGPGAPAIELAVQAGATPSWSPERSTYVVAGDGKGRAAERVWMAGSCATGALSNDEDGRRVAERVLSAL